MVKSDCVPCVFLLGHLSISCLILMFIPNTEIVRYDIIEHFDCDFYRDNNPDLYNIREGYLIKHYMQYGKDENRLPGASLFKKLYPGFDIDFYRKTNLQITGIREMSDNQIMCHYYRYGRRSSGVAIKFIKKEVCDYGIECTEFHANMSDASV